MERNKSCYGIKHWNQSQQYHRWAHPLPLVTQAPRHLHSLPRHISPHLISSRPKSYVRLCSVLCKTRATFLGAVCEQGLEFKLHDSISWHILKHINSQSTATNNNTGVCHRICRREREQTRRDGSQHILEDMVGHGCFYLESAVTHNNKMELIWFTFPCRDKRPTGARRRCTWSISVSILQDVWVGVLVWP